MANSSAVSSRGIGLATGKTSTSGGGNLAIPLLDTADLQAIAAQAEAMVAKYTPLNVASVSQSPAEQEVSPSSAVQLSAGQAERLLVNMYQCTFTLIPC